MNDTAIVANELAGPGANEQSRRPGKSMSLLSGEPGTSEFPLVLSFAAKGLNVMIYDLNVDCPRQAQARRAALRRIRSARSASRGIEGGPARVLEPPSGYFP